MNASLAMEQLAGTSPRTKARIAGAFYLVNIVTGSLAAAFTGRNATYGVVAVVAATIAYLVVTAIFYVLFKPVSSGLSLVAAGFSLAGCTVGILGVLHVLPSAISSLPFFGAYCLLIGALILGSTFLPRVLGVLMMAAGLGWVTFVSPSLASHLSPFNLLPGVVGEGALTLWLLIVGVNVQRWKEQATA